MTKWYEQNVDALSDWLFLQTIADLRRRVDVGTQYSVKSDDRYVVLGIAPLLRKLLLDGDRLISVVNRDRRLRIRFMISELRPNPARSEITQRTAEFDYTHAIAPTPISLAHNGKEVSLSGLLSTPVLSVGLDVLTAKTVIRYFANIEGGVHLSAPESESERALIEGSSQRLYGSDDVIITLVALGHVVLKGLAGLEENVRQSPRQPSAYVASAVV